jgi:hypothetical protein
MTRKEANLQILAKITEHVMLNPDIRFGQTLRNLGVIVDFMGIGPLEGSVQWSNHFNEEPTSMLKRMEEKEKQSKKEGLT